MGRRKRSIWWRYGMAVASILVATGGRWALDAATGTSFPFAWVFLAVGVSAWYGGFGPALLASVLGFASFWELPDTRPGPPAGTGIFWLGILFYVAISVGIAALGGIVAQARKRIADQIDEL